MIALSLNLYSLFDIFIIVVVTFDASFKPNSFAKILVVVQESIN
jgi:hypothetical protein